MKKSKLAFLPLFCFCAACTVKVPKGVISKHRMEQILYDYHQAQGMSEANPSLSLEDLMRKVFEKHGVSEADFDSSMVWYSGHATYLSEMYKNLDERIQKASTQLGIEVANMALNTGQGENGNVATVWRSTNLILFGKEKQNIRSFTIEADSTFRKGDTYTLRFTNRFVVQDSQREGYALLVARYDNDSTTAITTRLGGDYDATLRLPPSGLTSEHCLKSLQVTFYFNYANTQKDMFRLWIISNPTLVCVRQEPLPEVKPDFSSVVSDSVQVDSGLEEAPILEERQPRLSPTELRNQQADGERTINVERHRKVLLPAKTSKAKPAQH